MSNDCDLLNELKCLVAILDCNRPRPRCLPCPPCPPPSFYPCNPSTPCGPPMCSPCPPCGPPCGPCGPMPCGPCGPCPMPCGPCGPCGPMPCGPCGPMPCGPCGPCPMPCGPCGPMPCGPCGPCGPVCLPCDPCCFPCPPRKSISCETMNGYGNGNGKNGRSQSLNGRSLEMYGKRNGLQGKTFSPQYPIDDLANYKNNYANAPHFKYIPIELYNRTSLGNGNGGNGKSNLEDNMLCRGRTGGLFRGYGPGPIICASNPYDPCYPIKWKAPCFEKFIRNRDPCRNMTEYLFVKQTPVPALYPGPDGGEGARVEDLADMARQVPRLYAQNVCGYMC